MMVLHGTRMYGKTDDVPGLFFVATRFFHLNYFPLIPLGSYLVLHGTEKDEDFSGCQIKFSVKSLVLAWFRAGLWCFSIFLGFTAVEVFVLGQDARVYVVSILSCVGVLATIWASYRFTRASPLRALELASELSIPPEQVAEYFVDHQNLPKNGASA